MNKMNYYILTFSLLFLIACSEGATDSNNTPSTSSLDSSTIINGPTWTSTALDGYWELVRGNNGKYYYEFMDTWFDGSQGGKYDNLAPGVRIYKPVEMKQNGNWYWIKMKRATHYNFVDWEQELYIEWFYGKKILATLIQGILYGSDDGGKTVRKFGDAKIERK